MSHFAQLDEDNIVIAVTTSGQDDTEAAILERTGKVYKQTSYNTRGGVHSLGGTPFRKNYAGIGYSYDSVRDAFIPPKPYTSWTLNEDTCLWDAPVSYPIDGKHYIWDETTTSWIEI